MDADARLDQIRRTAAAQEAAARAQAEENVKRAIAASAQRVAEIVREGDERVKAAISATDAQLERLRSLEMQLSSGHASAQAESARSASRLLALRSNFTREATSLSTQQQAALAKVVSQGQAAINTARIALVSQIAKMKVRLSFGHSL